jgi:hypothetical protein
MAKFFISFNSADQISTDQRRIRADHLAASTGRNSATGQPAAPHNLIAKLLTERPEVRNTTPSIERSSAP